jgi:peptidyl-prolyl cis-trans isomerase A (cyclophilin A)
MREKRSEHMKKWLWIVLSLTLYAGPGLAQDTVKSNPTIVISTNKGTIEALLFQDKSPLTVENFIKYSEAKHYDGTVFHRVIRNFMIQGGGFDQNLSQKATRAPIKNEAANGLQNERGTLAMARTAVVDSATSQFFINLGKNAFLDHGSRDFGYAVFGKVIKGMDVVDAIAGVPTGPRGPFPGDCPLDAVIIESVRVK